MSKNRRVTPAELLQLRAAMSTFYPKCFAPKGGQKKPLKIGIYADLCERARKDFPGLSLRHIKGFIRDYCRGFRYLESLKAGAARVDMDGAFTGFVTKEQETKAKLDIAEMQKRRDAGRRKKPAKETPVEKLDRLRTAFANAEQSDSMFYSSGKASKLKAEISAAERAVDAGVPA